MSRTEETVSPPWGSLPVERYLLSKWDSSSDLSVDEQRGELVKAFVQENDISAFALTSAEAITTDRQELIQIVLVPWRSQKLRRIAKKYDPHNPLFDTLTVLRTHYGGSSDEKFTRWIGDACDAFDDMDPDGDLLVHPMTAGGASLTMLLSSKLLLMNGRTYTQSFLNWPHRHCGEISTITMCKKLRNWYHPFATPERQKKMTTKTPSVK
ncbi:hypothetical protein QX201_012104 [Fusarium graminearum]